MSLGYIGVSFTKTNVMLSLQDGQIPLMAAIEAGNLNVCRELLGYETAAQIKQVVRTLDEINALPF